MSNVLIIQYNTSFKLKNSPTIHMLKGTYVSLKKATGRTSELLVTDAFGLEGPRRMECVWDGIKGDFDHLNDLLLKKD